MIRAFALAIGQLFDPPIARLLIRVFLGAILALVIVSTGASWLVAYAVAHWASSGAGWLDSSLAVLGGVGAWVLGWLMLPFTILLVAGMVIDPVITAVERRHYPDLPPPRPPSVTREIASIAWLAGLGVIATIALLPFYLAAPGVNIVAHLLVNGFLLGRMYFEANAFRRLDPAATKRVWRRHRMGFVAAGAVIAVLSQIPFVNLIAPILATAFMTHVF